MHASSGCWQQVTKRQRMTMCANRNDIHHKQACRKTSGRAGFLGSAAYRLIAHISMYNTTEYPPRPDDESTIRTPGLMKPREVPVGPKREVCLVLWQPSELCVGCVWLAGGWHSGAYAMKRGNGGAALCRRRLRSNQYLPITLCRLIILTLGALRGNIGLTKRNIHPSEWESFT